MQYIYFSLIVIYIIYIIYIIYKKKKKNILSNFLLADLIISPRIQDQPHGAITATVYGVLNLIKRELLHSNDKLNTLIHSFCFDGEPSSWRADSCTGPLPAPPRPPSEGKRTSCLHASKFLPENNAIVLDTTEINIADYSFCLLKSLPAAICVSARRR